MTIAIKQSISSLVRIGLNILQLRSTLFVKEQRTTQVANISVLVSFFYNQNEVNFLQSIYEFFLVAETLTGTSFEMRVAPSETVVAIKVLYMSRTVVFATKV